ncbi:MAG: hypothetical protein Q9M13_06435 [Mariprofundales bacterium]|nr:hypothetical protein [Mariprofundales bacterium]
MDDKQVTLTWTQPADFGKDDSNQANNCAPTPGYEVCVSSSPNGGCDAAGVSLAGAGSTSYTFTPTASTPGYDAATGTGTWYWTVTAVNGSSAWVRGSETRQFSLVLRPDYCQSVSLVGQGGTGLYLQVNSKDPDTPGMVNGGDTISQVVMAAYNPDNQYPGWTTGNPQPYCVVDNAWIASHGDCGVSAGGSQSYQRNFVDGWGLNPGSSKEEGLMVEKLLFQDVNWGEQVPERLQFNVYFVDGKGRVSLGNAACTVQVKRVSGRTYVDTANQCTGTETGGVRVAVNAGDGKS